MGGTAWMFAMRWTMRLLGIVNIAILARLLEKDDFGLVAMTSAVIALPTALMDMGLEMAIIRERHATRSLYNTAWTLRTIQMSLVAIVVWLAAPAIADFYNEPRVQEILLVLAVAVFLQGLENIWVVSFRRDLRFRTDFLYNASCKLLAVVTTVGLAIYLRSYWALVYGQLVASALRLAVSWSVAPGRPKPSFEEIRRIWSFSQWSLLKGGGKYVMAHADRIILGRVSTADVVGNYTVAREVAAMAISEISAPVNRVLGPGFSSLQADPTRLDHAIRKTMSALAAITMPVGVGLALTAEELVTLLLGGDWITAVPILQILALSSAFSTLQALLGNALTVLGYIRTSTSITWIRATLFLAFGIPAARYYGPVGIATAFFFTQFVAFLITIAIFPRRVQFQQRFPFLAGLARPVISTIGMAIAVLYVAQWTLGGPLISAIAKVGTGIAVYGSLLTITWKLAGSPDGIERIIWDRLFGRTTK
jgi:lipopolysaccharide exporter